MFMKKIHTIHEAILDFVQQSRKNEQLVKLEE